jgi:hypothetical protein
MYKALKHCLGCDAGYPSGSMHADFGTPLSSKLRRSKMKNEGDLVIRTIFSTGLSCMLVKLIHLDLINLDLCFYIMLASHKGQAPGCNRAHDAAGPPCERIAVQSDGAVEHVNKSKAMAALARSSTCQPYIGDRVYEFWREKRKRTGKASLRRLQVCHLSNAQSVR